MLAQQGFLSMFCLEDCSGSADVFEMRCRYYIQMNGICNRAIMILLWFCNPIYVFVIFCICFSFVLRWHLLVVPLIRANALLAILLPKYVCGLMEIHPSILIRQEALLSNRKKEKRPISCTFSFFMFWLAPLLLLLYVFKQVKQMFVPWQIFPKSRYICSHIYCCNLYLQQVLTFYISSMRSPAHKPMYWGIIL